MCQCVQPHVQCHLLVYTCRACASGTKVRKHRTPSYFNIYATYCTLAFKRSNQSQTKQSTNCCSKSSIAISYVMDQQGSFVGLEAEERFLGADTGWQGRPCQKKHHHPLHCCTAQYLPTADLNSLHPPYPTRAKLGQPGSQKLAQNWEGWG